MGLRCRIFGHDWRTKVDEGYYTITSASDWCRKCGITKKDIRNMKGEGNK